MTEIVGILNITEDSFSDGGQYLRDGKPLEDEIVRRGQQLLSQGATWLDIGAASSHPDSVAVDSDTEISRLKAVLCNPQLDSTKISVDSCNSEAQKFALAQGVGMLNDICGFADPQLYPELAASDCKLVIMHSMLATDRAQRDTLQFEEVWQHLMSFFRERIRSLLKAGIAENRLILDPGMGFFLSAIPQVSIDVLRRLPDLHAEFGLPTYVCVSRKSFLGSVTGTKTGERGAATLSAELYAARNGVRYIRTHDPLALAQGITVERHLDGLQKALVQ